MSFIKIADLAAWLISFCYGGLIFLILREFLPVRSQRRVLWVLEILLLFSSVNIVVYPQEVTGSFGSLFCLVLILMVFHKKKWYLKLSAAFLFFPIMTGISYVTQDIGSLIWMYGFQKDMSEAAQTLLHTCTLALRIPIWYGIYRWVKLWLPRAADRLTLKMWIVLDLISLTSFVGIVTVIYKCTSRDSYMAYPACAASLVTGLGCCYLCSYMAKTVRAEMELESYQYQKSYYQELENSQQLVRSLRHDMKNHLSLIGTFLRDQDYGQAQSYLSQLTSEFSAAPLRYCPDPIINAVLNTKLQAAKENGIRCQVQVDLQETPAMEDIELCSLFANTLDNALEACVKIPDPEKRTLSLKARCKNRCFSYELINSRTAPIVEENGVFKSDKKENGEHGLGLKNVKRIVEKYDGELALEYDQQDFHLTVAILGLS